MRYFAPLRASLAALFICAALLLQPARAQTLYPPGSSLPVGQTTQGGRSNNAEPPAPPADAAATNDENAPAAFTFVGSFHISNGAYWFSSPPCYTAREAAAFVFGGQPTDYAISVNANTTDPATITHTAFLDGFGSTQFLSTPASEDFKGGTNYQSGSFSAFVHDHFVHGQGPINYVWRNNSPAATPVTAGQVLISEFRFIGPLGTQDEYVELYNNTNAQIVVGASDGSAGWALRASDGTTRLVVPNGVIIPARGYYLAYGEPDYSSNRYSLANYGGTNLGLGNANFQLDIPANAGVALFSSATTFDASTRLDAVGFSAVTDSLYREGAGLTNAIATTTEHSFVRKLNAGVPQDTGNNAADFQLVAPTAPTLGNGSILGAPGPKRNNGPIQRNATIKSSFVDGGCAGTSAGADNLTTCARNRNPTPDAANNSDLGTLSVRRTFKNNTGLPVTRLRFRMVDITTAPAPAGTADLRLRSSANYTAACVGTGGGCAMAGQVITINGTTLEQPPTQTIGGGLNSSLAVGTITMAQALAPGASINLQFLLGVKQTGAYRFFINVEADTNPPTGGASQPNIKSSKLQTDTTARKN